MDGHHETVNANLWVVTPFQTIQIDMYIYIYILSLLENPNEYKGRDPIPTHYTIYGNQYKVMELKLLKGLFWGNSGASLWNDGILKKIKTNQSPSEAPQHTQKSWKRMELQEHLMKRIGS